MSDSEISAGQISTYQLKQQVSLYEKALEDPAIADSSQQRMELLKRLMDINDILQLDHRLMYYIDQLRDAAIENKDDAYRAMAEFMMGKRLHYHHDTIRGYQLCRKAIELMEANDCYKLWQQQEGNSPVEDMEMLDYLIVSQHHEEAMNVIHRYRDFLRAECDTIDYRMINVLSTGALLHAMRNELEVSKLNSELINEIADSLRLRNSQGAMSYAYNLIMEEKHAHRQTIVIIALSSFVLLLILMGAAILYFTKKIRQRNKKLLRILNALEAYRNIMAEQTDKSEQKPTKVKALEEEQRMFVEIDARVTNERPFTDPDFDHESLIKFSGIDEELFVRMMARYTHALNSMSYINSRRAEYGARLIIEQPHEDISTIAKECGFRSTDAFNHAFKFALGVTPTEYRNSMLRLFKNES